MQSYQYTKEVNLERLEGEIKVSSIITALDHLSSLGSDVSIFFKADLSLEDRSTLDSIVDQHVNIPLVVEQPIQIVTPTVPKNDHGLRGRKFKEVFTPTLENASYLPHSMDIAINNDDYKNMWLWGNVIKVKGYNENDYIIFQIVDLDGIGVARGWYTQEQFTAMGEYVVKQYADWYLEPFEGKINLVHPPTTSPGEIYSGLYIRMIYQPNAADEIKIWVNLVLAERDGDEA